MVLSISSDCFSSFSFFISGDFFIDQTTGVVKTNTILDRETQPYYNLTITASDNGTPPLSSSMEARIAVLDLNDNAPKFEKSVYEISVHENVTVSTVLVRVSFGGFIFVFQSGIYF